MSNGDNYRLKNVKAVQKVKRDPELMELTRKIIEQNDVILKMNAQLLALMSMPAIVMNTTTPEDKP